MKHAMIKKIVIMAAICLYLPILKAQFVLDHVFNSHLILPSYAVRVLSDICNNYYHVRTFDSSGCNYTFYNLDYTLYKTGKTKYNVDQYTQKIFNSDDKLEYLRASVRSSSDYPKIDSIWFQDEEDHLLALISKEDLKDCDYIYSYNIYLIKGKYKLVVWWINTAQEEFTCIYSLQGIPEKTKDIVAANTNFNPYPNPANTTISLPYQLSEGENSIMNIYNINGQLIEKKQIGSDFNQILLNVSDYPKGIYLYEVNGQSHKFIVK